MEINLDILARIKIAIRNQDYELAIELSGNGESDAFYIAAFQKVQRLNVNQSFWSSFFSESAALLLKHEAALPLLVKFWSTEWSLKQVNQFATQDSRRFIHSLRVSGVFMNAGVLEMLISLGTADHYVNWHLTKMRLFRDKRAELKNRVNGFHELLSQLSLAAFLSELIIWWENSTGDSLGHQNRLFRLVDDALSAYFKRNPDATTSNNESNLVLRQKLADYHQKEKLQTDTLMSALNELESFETSELEEYQYELRHDFNESGEFVFYNQAKTKFIQDNLKLMDFQAYWNSRAVFNVTLMIDEGKIKLKSENDFDVNSYVGSEQAQLLLEYVASFEVLSETEELIPAFFSTLQAHALSRYRARLDEAKKRGNSPLEALAEVMITRQGHSFPIQVNPLQVFRQKVFTTFKGNVSPELIKELVPRALSSSENFNLLEKPIILTSNDQTINLLNLTSEGNFFLRSYYSIARPMKGKISQVADKQFEKQIAAIFQWAGFDSCNIEKYGLDSEHGSPVQGDVDVLVTEGDIALFLEVKRVKLRYDSSGIWSEYEKLSWGSLQLKKLDLAIADPDSDVGKALPGNVKHIHKLLITPWFEYDHQKIGGVMKVSWFEIMYALEQMKDRWSEKPNRLGALIKLINDDEIWPQIFTKARSYEEQLIRLQKELK